MEVFEYIYLSTEFDGEIVDFYEEKGFVYLLISNKPNRYKIENSSNYKYDFPFLYDFLEKNDRVIKRKCSDTLFVQRNLKKYHFLIENSLYNNKEKSKEFIQKYNLKRAILNEYNDCN